MIMFLRFV